MLTDAEIAGYMGWRGPGAYTELKMRKVKAAIIESVAREREACANVCEELRDKWAKLKVGAADGRYELLEEAASVCEDEIRMRSNATGEQPAANELNKGN